MAARLEDLETTAASLIASDPLAALITTVTPVGGYVSIALRAALADVVSAATKATPLSGPLVIAVDTLEIAAGDTVIAAPGVDIKRGRSSSTGSGDGDHPLRHAGGRDPADDGRDIRDAERRLSGGRRLGDRRPPATGHLR